MKYSHDRWMCFLELQKFGPHSMAYKAKKSKNIMFNITLIDTLNIDTYWFSRILSSYVRFVTTVLNWGKKVIHIWDDIRVNYWLPFFSWTRQDKKTRENQWASIFWHIWTYISRLHLSTVKRKKKLFMVKKGHGVKGPVYEV